MRHFDNPMLRAGQRPGGVSAARRPSRHEHRRACGLAAVLPRRRYRLARRARHHQRRRHGRRPAALSVRRRSSWRRAFRSPISSASSLAWRRRSRLAGVPIVTGDTKVVERGKGDGVFITTTGVGVVPEGVDVSGDKARPGDDHPAQRHASATTASPSCRSARTWSSRPRSAPTAPRCMASSPTWWRRCRTSGCCATRRAAGSPPR